MKQDHKIKIVASFVLVGGLLGWWYFNKKDSSKFMQNESSLAISNNIKVVIFAPEENADDVRKAIGAAGAGRIELYDYCSFSIKGIGGYRPLEGSQPAIGQKLEIASTPEIRIETICSKEQVHQIIEAARKVHPYETMGYDLYPLLELKNNNLPR